MFSPARVKQSRLAPIGYTNHVPAIRAKVCLYGHHELPIVAAMLSNRMGISKVVLDNIAASRMEVVPAKHKLRNIPAWRTFTSIFHNLLDRSVCKSMHDDATMHVDHLPLVDKFSLACPKCNRPKEIGNRTLIKGGKWSVITCNWCKAPAKASRWKCECESIWYTCAIHASMGFACRANNKRKLEEKTNKVVDHSLFPSLHDRETPGPSRGLQSFVSEQIWDSLPRIQHRAILSKKLKCASQQQYSIIDNRPVFSITGTNVSKPGLKRKRQDENADLVRAVARRRECSMTPDSFEATCSSKAKGIGNTQEFGTSNAVGTEQAIPEASCSWQRMQPDQLTDSSMRSLRARSSCSNMQEKPTSAWEQVQARFRAKFARSAGQPFDPPSNQVELSHAAPASQGQQHEITQDHRWAPPQVPVEQICPMRVKRKAPTSSIRVAGVKWGKPDPKKASKFH